MSKTNQAISSKEPNKKFSPATRPWQGTVLAIISIVGLIVTAIFLPFTILMIIAGGALSFVQDLGPIFSLLIGGGGVVLTLMLIIYFILGIFITKGLFKGKKWTLIILLIFSFLNLLQIIFNFNLFVLIIIAIFLYLEIACLLHPFYGNKK